MQSCCVSLLLFAVVGVKMQTDDQWRPPNLAKMYKPGEPTYISTYGNGQFNQAWYVTEDRQQFVFQVESCHGAMLAFLTYSHTSGDPTVDDQQEIVELILGAHDNERSLIRYGIAGNRQTVFNTSTPSVLHCNELRSFWMTWDHSIGVVKVGKGPLTGEQGFMQWTNNKQSKQFYNAIALACVTGSAALWKVYENSAAFLAMDTPDEHKYITMWKSVENKAFWSFAVRAGGDVHVVLTSRLGRTDSDLYEFVIGGWHNNMSVIRTELLGGGDSIKGTYNQSNLVSDVEMRHFWISWYDGLISFGRGAIYGKGRLLSWKDTRPITVRYLSISTGFGNKGRWSMNDDQESMSYVFTNPKADGNLTTRYDAWLISPQQNYFTFAITTCEEASVLFSSSVTVDQSFAIELVIGWTQNTRTVVRYSFSNVIINVTDSLNVLSCLEFRSFWVSWHNGMLRVGSGYTYSRDVIIEAQIFDSSSTTTPINALAFATPMSAGQWRFREVGDVIRIETPSVFDDFNQYWRSVTIDQFAVFRVRACSDCHVALSPTLGVDCGENYLDMVISGWQNTQSQIRRVIGCAGERGAFSEAVDTRGLLDCARSVDIWVSWDSGRLRFGRGVLPGYHIILDHPLNQTYTVQAISLSSGFGQTAHFTLESDTGDYYMFYTGTSDSLRWLLFDQATRWVSMKIRACTVIDMYLSTSMDKQQDYFNIKLGLENNTKSQLYSRSSLVMEANTPNLFSCWDDRHVWISWNADGSHVEVGSGWFPSNNAFLRADERNYFPIRAMGFRTENVGDDEYDDNYFSRLTVSRNSFQQIQFETPVDFRYDQIWEGVEHRRGVTFGVKACSDVHIILANKVRMINGMYDIVIGGWYNSRSAIRIPGISEYVTAETMQILHCSEVRYFWITWQFGTIEVGKGLAFGWNKFMAYQPLQLYNVHAVGYSTGYGHDGTWTVSGDDRLLPTSPPITEAPGLPPTANSKDGDSTGLNPGQVGGIIIGVLALAVVTLNVILYIRSQSSALDLGTPSPRVATTSGGSRSTKRNDNSDLQPSSSTATDMTDSEA